MNFISTDLYKRKGKAINNFEFILPDVNSYYGAYYIMPLILNYTKTTSPLS